MGKGFAYPPELFTNPESAKTVHLSDTHNDIVEAEVVNFNFIGEFC